MADCVNFYEKLVVLLMLYMVQGLPYGFQDKYLPVYYRSEGLAYTSLSLFRIVYIPWLLKMVWAPFVDNMKSKPKCILICMIMMIVCNIIAYFVDPASIYQFAGAMLLMNIFASIHDVALDTYALSSLSTEDLGKGNTAQVVGYKIGMIMGSGGVAYISQRWGHPAVFVAMSALILMVLVAYIAFLTQYEPMDAAQITELEPLIRNEVLTASEKSSKSKTRLRKFVSTSDDIAAKRPMSLSESYSDPLDRNRFIAREQKTYSYLDALHTPGTSWTIAFVLIYKLGESGALALFPLFLLDAGLNRAKVHLWHGVVGQISSIVGSVVGGVYASNTDRICKYMTIACIVRTIIMLGIREVVVNTNDLLVQERDINLLYSSFFLLTFLNFVSGALTTITFTHMMLMSQMAPTKHQALHYSFLATAELLGKFILGIGMGPGIDQYGEDIAITAYTALSLAVFPLLWIHNRYIVGTCWHE